MALIQCPECLKRVSETAESCPNCGYSIRNHIEREERKNRQENERAAFDIKFNEAYEKLKPEMNRKLKAIDDMPAPKKPTYIQTMFSGDGSWMSWFIVIAFVILLFLIFILPGANIFLVLLLVADLIFGIFIFALGYGDYKSFLDLYEKKLNPNYKNSEKERIQKEYLEYARNMAQYGQRTMPMPNVPRTYSYNPHNIKCPVCSSNNIKRISDLNRTASVATFGIASSKIGKQYECLKCKHKW